MTVITDLLDGLVSDLRGLGLQSPEMLVPGLDRSEIGAAIDGLDLEEAYEWYGWHNGIDVPIDAKEGDLFFTPGYRLMSLSESLELSDIYGEDDEVQGPLFPLLTSPAGDSYSIVKSGPNKEIMFRTVEHMLAVFRNCFARQAFFIGDSGYLDMNAALFEELRMR
jgi:hypothetical protein